MDYSWAKPGVKCVFTGKNRGILPRNSNPRLLKIKIGIIVTIRDVFCHWNRAINREVIGIRLMEYVNEPVLCYVSNETDIKRMEQGYFIEQFRPLNKTDQSMSTLRSLLNSSDKKIIDLTYDIDKSCRKKVKS